MFDSVMQSIQTSMLCVQLKYLRQLHALLSDAHVKRSAMHRDVVKWAKALVSALFDRLDPPPIALPASALPPVATGAADVDAADAVNLADGDVGDEAGPSAARDGQAMDLTGDGFAGASGSGAGARLTEAALAAHNGGAMAGEGAGEAAEPAGTCRPQRLDLCYTVACDSQTVHAASWSMRRGCDALTTRQNLIDAQL